MIAPTQSAPLYRDPGVLARLFVYAFALATPLLTLAVIFLPAALVGASGSWAVALTATAGYVAALAFAVKRVRILAARFTPPLPLPGDIWNIGVAQPPRRSNNWPIRLRRRPRPTGGVPAKPDLRAAA